MNQAQMTSGFTLIELLIVIAIIGILMAVLVPQLLLARKAANIQEAISLTRNVVNLAEIKRANAGDQIVYSTATSCSPALIDKLPGSIATCEVKQDANTSYVRVISKTNVYFYFNGQKMDGPLYSPLNW